MELKVKEKFASYPEEVSLCLLTIRKLIFKVAQQDDIAQIIETLKWGQISYLSQFGSTIRIDWSSKHPEYYCIYFHCQTVLIETFKALYGDTFTYQGNRAIVLMSNAVLPEAALRHCISMSLRYHQIKHLTLLGA